MPQPPQDESPTEPIQALPTAASALKPPKTRHSTSTLESLPLSHSESSLPFRRPNPSTASLYASTLSPPGSRSMSPVGRGSPSRAPSGAAFDSAVSRVLSDSTGDNPDEPLNLILRAFVPHVSVYASDDTEALIKEKGFKNGLWELLRPFGENVQGKVTVRDSNGLSRPFEDFSIRLTRLGDNVEHPDPTGSGIKPAISVDLPNGVIWSPLRDRKTLSDVEAVVERHLSYAEGARRPGTPDGPGSDEEAPSPYYALYLRRLLCGMPITPHETFAHPVACIIAISSRNPTPIEELRRLYSETSEGAKRLPPWVDSDYLRYYVLVHDEENDDITRSMGLFDQMKRNLGQHCHLLRLRSSQCVETDDDSIPFSGTEWKTAVEELLEIRRSDNEVDYENPTRYIFESDATAIRTFIREMVTQSIVPNMERHMNIWNDQVASRRRGLTGRFMNLSRKWAGFGAVSRTSSGGGSATRDNYDGLGFFRADTPEAIMRKLADYAFMLRDWKLAHSTYDLLRSDFGDSKAWKYHAAANEMAAASLLIMPQQAPSKGRSETVEQMIEAAFYSYNTRCSAPYGALRSVNLGLELLRLRGGTSVDDAGRWGLRLLDSKILGQIGDALTKERLAVCYASKQGVGSLNWGNRRRKSAAWSVLAAEAWIQQAKYRPAYMCFKDAERRYALLPQAHGISQFEAANAYLSSMQLELSEKLEIADDEGEDADGGGSQESIDEESEALMDLRTRRPSTVVRPGALETAPLHGDETSGSDDTTTGAAQQGFD
ncbi:Transport protein particle subunit trs85-2 [Paramyrothecium foliicola]|nr:Transport protein particle subunit trs85-2 [Paramyrothecium foliicola]